LRITLISTGTRGDVQPFAALGQGLRHAGHQVRIATHGNFAGLVKSLGLDFYNIMDDAQRLHAEDNGRFCQSGCNPFQFTRDFLRMRAPILEELLENCWQASRDADVIVTSVTALFEGYCVAERLRKPLCYAFLQPTAITRHSPNCMFPEWPRYLPFRGLYNRATHVSLALYHWYLLRPILNQARERALDLPTYRLFQPPLKNLRRPPVLYGFSPTVINKPPDWEPRHHLTGYWFLDTDSRWTPPRDLAAFLDDGPAPVVIGFGSMNDGTGAQRTKAILDALQKTRLRAVLLTGWGALEGVPRSDQFCAVESVPHDWLFPRAAAVVHHGGAGTAAACFRAGVPAVVTPFISDQGMWGRRAHELGVSPRPIAFRGQTGSAFAAALRQATEDPLMRLRAAELGGKIRAEDGIGQAVELMEQLFDESATAHRPLKLRTMSVRS
jgi:UDP:flavonoid glycosyltransferase YjiC (YdhE family)